MRQTSIAYGHRVWKRQPGGGFAGDGMSPWSTTRRRVRCCFGRANVDLPEPEETQRGLEKVLRSVA